jgi:hypothetical protein
MKKYLPFGLDLSVRLTNFFTAKQSLQLQLINLVAHIERENRLRVLENRVLRRIFGPKRDEETGEWRRLHNEELHVLYPHQISFG